jgi:phage repressor protein C with HTH and peptisase S24 domain
LVPKWFVYFVSELVTVVLMAKTYPNGLKAAMNAVNIGPTKLAETIGTNRQNVTRWSKWQRKLPVDMAQKMAPVLNTTPEKLLLPPTGDAPQIIRPAGPEPSEVEPATNAPTLSQMGDFDVEVRGISVGGEDDEFYFNGEVIDHIRRLPGIKRAKNVFALNVSGESMMPRYEPGEPIYVQKTNPVAGDYVVVELFPETEGQSGKAFLKQLVRRTGLRVICKQFNPPKEVEFDAGEVKDIYRVLKPKDLLG